MNPPLDQTNEAFPKLYAISQVYPSLFFHPERTIILNFMVVISLLLILIIFHVCMYL